LYIDRISRPITIEFGADKFNVNGSLRTLFRTVCHCVVNNIVSCLFQASFTSKHFFVLTVTTRCFKAVKVNRKN